MSQKETFFTGTKSVNAQFIMVTILIVGYSVIIIDSDITFFDFYVLPDIAECYPENQTEHCLQTRELLGCGMTEQECIGNKYWEQVNKQAIGLGAVLFFARLIPSLHGYFTQGRRLTWVSFFEPIWWGSLAVLVFLGGVIDYGYYTMRGMDLPDALPWLNSVGLFEYTKQLTGDIAVVESLDLVLTMALSIFLIGLIYLSAVLAYKTTNLKGAMA